MVEIIPKQSSGPRQTSSIVFFFAAAFLAFLLIAFFTFMIYLGSYMKKISELDAKISSFGTEENISLEREILGYQSKFQDFSQLLQNHKSSAKIFQFVEKNTHPDVWFNKFQVDTTGREVTLAGTAKTFESLGQQMILFKKEELFDVSQLALAAMNKSGGVDFIVIIKLNSDSFNFQP